MHWLKKHNGPGEIAVVGLVVSLLGLVLVQPDEKASVEAVRARGPIVVLTLNSPTTYYEARDGEFAGLEYDLTQSFAQWLGVKAEYRVLPNLTAVLEALEQNPGAIAAAGLTPTSDRARLFSFSLPYQRIEQEVVCHRRVDMPESLEGLAGVSLMVTGASSYLHTLKEIQKTYPEVKWTENSELATEQILELVWRRKVDCAIADSNIVDINRRYFPELEVPLSLGDQHPLAWAMGISDGPLRTSVNAWMRQMRQSGRLTALRHRYYGYLEEFDYYDTRVFRKRVNSRLPRYEKLIRRAAKKYGFSWTLLAAMAYQESHWDPEARSATGVRGIMMLTRNTASALGVENRLDPEQSVMGGARYLKRMERRLPKEVKGSNRQWLALAAYNVGMGHLNDARQLARKLGRDPNRWVQLREVLPKLSQQQYFTGLKHGYARGLEPVRYVQRIRNYRDLLEQIRRGSRRPASAKKRPRR